MKSAFGKAFLAIWLLLALSGFASHVWAAKYYAIVDAGSSGSRLYLYKSEADARGNPVAENIPLAGNKVTPGISTLVTQPSKVGAYIAPLFNLLDAELKARGVPQTDVKFSLMATAGMRVESPLQQKKVYEAVADEAKKTLPGMNVQYTLTLQGRYEGAFQWLSVNYLKGNLAAGGGTNGVLETGGGSYQMTWATSVKARNTIDIFSLTYGVTPYTLFSRSYTGLGGNYSREDATDDPSSFPVGYPLASGAVGSGNYRKGLVNTRKLIRARPTAIPEAVKVPRLESFVGVGLFKNVATNLKLGDSISSARVDRAATVIALTPWAVQVSEQPNNPFLFGQVDSAQLVSELIRTWFQSNRELPVADQINGTEISWTLGAVLFLASNNLLPTQW